MLWNFLKIQQRENEQFCVLRFMFDENCTVYFLICCMLLGMTTVQ